MIEENLEVSKSEVKRQIKKIKDLGVSLSKLSKGQLKTIPLSEEVLIPVIELQNITSNVAKKRLTQYVAKMLMRQENLNDIEKAFDNILGQTQQVDAEFHLAERWRDQLLSEEKDTYMTDFMKSYSNISSQELRHLINKVLKERKLQINHGASKALFRFIKQALSANE